MEPLIRRSDSDTPIKKEWDDDLGTFLLTVDGYKIPGIKQEDRDSNDLEIIGDDELDDMSVELDLAHTDEDEFSSIEEEENIEMHV